MVNASSSAQSGSCRLWTVATQTRSGQMLLEQRDEDLPGVLPLVLKRTHLSDYTFGVWFGRSWASTLDERIEVDIRNQAMWAREDGTVLVHEQLPGPQSPEVWPLEGPRIPLRRISEMGAQDLEFAATDPRTGWTRYFSKPGDKGRQLWPTTLEDPMRPNRSQPDQPHGPGTCNRPDAMRAAIYRQLVISDVAGPR